MTSDNPKKESPKGRKVSKAPVKANPEKPADQDKTEQGVKPAEEKKQIPA